MYELPTNQYGMFVEVMAPDDPEDHAASKRFALNAFRKFVKTLRLGWDLAKVYDFQWLVKADDSEHGPTYGWKCRVRFARTVPQ